MPKTKKIKNIDFEKIVMTKVKSDQIVMKPRWYFILGSSFLGLSLVGLSMGAIFLVNLTFFLLRGHGPMGQWKLQMMLQSFPLWIPIVATIGIFFGILILKKYDFSYKKNFLFISIAFLFAIIIAAFILDYSGISDTWLRQGPMRRFYQQEISPELSFPRGQGWRQNIQNQ